MKARTALVAMYKKVFPVFVREFSACCVYACTKVLSVLVRDFSACCVWVYGWVWQNAEKRAVREDGGVCSTMPCACDFFVLNLP